MPVRLRVLLAGMAIPLALWLAVPLVSQARLSDRARDLDKRIERRQGSVDRQRRRETRLNRQIGRYDRTISRLQGRIGGLRSRQTRLQTDLDSKLAELAGIQESLRKQRARLVRLRARLSTGRRVLSERLIELYKAGQPDVVTVILESDGFADLLERSEFLGRVSRQDRRIITRVTADKVESVATTKRLTGLEVAQKEISRTILAKRNEVASVREQVTSERDNFAGARDKRGALLVTTRKRRRKAQEDVAALQAESKKVQARLGALSGGSGGTAGPIRGGGQLIWPVNGPITSPFCERRAWEACHPGIDIGVPSGTPIRAAGSGRVVLAGPQGGYGNYTCVQHSSSLSSCYAHQSSIGVRVGQRVSRGQVIGRSGCTGLCFGAHLHFEVRIGGAVTNPLSYLR